MKCTVCGEKIIGTGTCPVCGYKVINTIGKLTEEQKYLISQKTAQKTRDLLSKYKIYIHGYNWEDKDGIIVEHSQEDFLVARELDKIELNSVSWGNTLFAKTGDGKPIEIGIVIENDNAEKRTIRSTVKVPETEGLWSVGVVLKPGLKAALRIGDEKKYVDTNIFSLKG